MYLFSVLVLLENICAFNSNSIRSKHFTLFSRNHFNKTLRMLIISTESINKFIFGSFDIQKFINIEKTTSFD